MARSTNALGEFLRARRELVSPEDAGLRPGGNQLRDLFVEASAQALHPDWPAVAGCFVANLRQAVGTDVDDPRSIELTGELSLASARSAGLWARHDVRGQRGAPVRFDHPQVGLMTLDRERLSVDGAGGLWMVVHHPDAGSDDAEKLALLASSSAPGGGTGTEDQEAAADRDPLGRSGATEGRTRVVDEDRA